MKLYLAYNLEIGQTCIHLENTMREGIDGAIICKEPEGWD